MSLFSFLNDLLQFRKIPFKTPEELQAAFTAKYRNFRTLLTANNNALEIIAEMEQTLAAGQTFSMAFVRAKATAVMVNVYKMVRCLLDMSSGRYAGLDPAFTAIQGHVEAILNQQPAIAKGEWVLALSQIDRSAADQVGEKMANIGEVRNRVGLAVPPGFAITSSAGLYFFTANLLQEEINTMLQTLNPDDLEALYETSARIQQRIAQAPLPGDLARAIDSAHQRLVEETSPEVTVSMRSSAIGEDTGLASFAGQYRTELHVSKEFVGQTFKEILASKYSSRAIVYRLRKGYRDEDVAMCVGCQAMVEAKASGVMYSQDPGDIRSAWSVISAVPGLAKAVVDGTDLTDLFLVSRDPPHPVLRKKLREGLRLPDNGTQKDLQAPAPTITEEQAAALTGIALQLENHFGHPQDVEWSIDTNGRIIILQSRPIHETESTESLTKALPQATHKELLAGGVTASPGVACGPVYIVASNVDLLQFPTGAILVTKHPVPEWAPLLNRAVALLAETGSVAGHLATVAREFGIPALFGLDKVTERLRNHEEITVDATGRRIYPGREEQLLALAPQKPDLMAGSPVQLALKDILEHTAPLNLTNPDSPYFRPKSCKTLHDITRFCHEKAVFEMFSFGKDYGFDERAAKRLVDKVPSEWWVLNLANGFREGLSAKEKFIRIEDIASAPMRAIWAGITAIPWQGPPPVSIRGLGSIFFQSTMNPSLDPAVANVMTEKNYFLVAKRFCNLSVRLGYHFSMIEAYAGDLRTENYASFQFKGGAADAKRKGLRVALISSVLQKYDFRVEAHGDRLTARLEKEPAAILLERLKILGYLSMHTRQIDMVMENMGRVQYYENKFMADIDLILKTNGLPSPENS